MSSSKSNKEKYNVKKNIPKEDLNQIIYALKDIKEAYGNEYKWLKDIDFRDDYVFPRFQKIRKKNAKNAPKDKHL